MTDIEALATQEYKYGFVTDIESHTLPKGLSEDTIREIWRLKKEPDFMLDWRLKAYRHWLTLVEPTWANVRINPVDYQDITYYSAPIQKKALDSLDEVDQELLETFEKLGIPLSEQKRLAGVAVDASSTASRWPHISGGYVKHGIIFFRSPSAEVPSGPGAEVSRLVVPYSDNFYAPSSGRVQRRVILLHPGRRACPMELSTYFRIIQRGRAVRAHAIGRRGR